MPLLPLSAEDRRALGWFDLSLESPAASAGDTVSASSGEGESVQSHGSAPVELFPAQVRVDEQPLEQLPLQLEGMGA